MMRVLSISAHGVHVWCPRTRPIRFCHCVHPGTDEGVCVFAVLSCHVGHVDGLVVWVVGHAFGSGEVEGCESAE
jgi:hypothetical protein